ncbi:MAG: hypothetical protein ACAI44_02695 [Candidatus Sericytochromatia bacterium]
MYSPTHPQLIAGLKYQQQQSWKYAAACYVEALAEVPAESYYLLGRLAYVQGLSSRANQYLEAALEEDPGFWPALALLGNLELLLGNASCALKHFQAVLELQPEEHGIQLSLGQAWKALGKLWKARLALTHYTDAFPEDAVGWDLLAEITHSLGLGFQELICLDRCLALRQHDPDLLLRLGSALNACCRFDRIPDYYQGMLALNPAGASWFASLPEQVRDYLEPYQYQLHFRHLFALYRDPEITDQQLFDSIDALPPTDPVAPLPPPKGSNAPGGLPDRPLRIGYLSREFASFSSSTLLRFLLRHHGPDVELHAYNDTPQSQWTALTDSFKAMFTFWRDVDKLDNAFLAQLIRLDGIDVLVDMGGITLPRRHDLFARKPALVQVGGLGFGFSACHRGLDYCLTDRGLCPPEIANRYPESVVYLSSAIRFEPPKAIELTPVPFLKNGYLTLGSANSLTKLNQRVVALWARVLKALPESKLWLKTPEFNDPLARTSYLERFAQFGVDEARLRLEGQGSEPHMAYFYSQIDIALDPFPAQGGVTTCEALWMGVPVVSLQHPDWRARSCSANILTLIGHHDWPAMSEEAYLQRVLEWATDPDFLRLQRQALRHLLLNSEICNGPGFAREVEAAYRWMWTEARLKS